MQTDNTGKKKVVLGGKINLERYSTFEVYQTVFAFCLQLSKMFYDFFGELTKVIYPSKQMSWKLI